MDSETPNTALALPVFDGDNYHIWAVRMEAHLKANDTLVASNSLYGKCSYVYICGPNRKMKKKNWKVLHPP